MNDITILQIIDTAVKIGLGALISGIAAYLVTKTTHREEARKLRSRRRSDLFEQVAEQVEEATHVALKYWAA